jgi:hypothetical protein
VFFASEQLDGIIQSGFGKLGEADELGGSEPVMETLRIIFLLAVFGQGVQYP